MANTIGKFDTLQSRYFLDSWFPHGFMDHLVYDDRQDLPRNFENRLLFGLSALYLVLVFIHSLQSIINNNNNNITRPMETFHFHFKLHRNLISFFLSFSNFIMKKKKRKTFSFSSSFVFSNWFHHLLYSPV